MKKTVHRAADRGSFDHGWLQTKHSFSFASWHDPDRMGFGKLRVINDDVIAPGKGFGSHAHENMEIVTIPLAGTLAHKDSEGNEQLLGSSDIQVMSAGTGIRHSEYNHSAHDAANLLQIWVLPDHEGHHPRYDQKSFDPSERSNRFQTVVAPSGEDGALHLNQDAYFSLADLEDSRTAHYEAHTRGNGLYLYVIEGEVTVEGETLTRRDAIGMSDTAAIEVLATQPSQILLIEVPMG